jgi:uncharacterized protein YjbJ (UPF0337 family)
MRGSFNRAHPLLYPSHTPTKEQIMAEEDVVAGKVKQVKGKANDIAGAVKGDTAQQVKGKVQKAVGKVQEALGKSNRPADE